MNPKIILNEAASLIDQRGVNYGGIEANFDRAAKLSSLKLDRTITPYEVAIILSLIHI